MVTWIFWFSVLCQDIFLHYVPWMKHLCYASYTWVFLGFRPSLYHKIWTVMGRVQSIYLWITAPHIRVSISWIEGERWLLVCPQETNVWSWNTLNSKGWSQAREWCSDSNTRTEVWSWVGNTLSTNHRSQLTRGPVPPNSHLPNKHRVRRRYI